MSDEKVTQNNTEEAKADAPVVEKPTTDAPATDAPATEAASTDAKTAPAAKSSAPAARTPQKREFKKNRRSNRGRRERPRSEFDQKILGIRRVTRVSSGGRRFSFSVAMVIGDKKGRVGVGTGKAGDTALAIDKAIKSAKKNMITVKRTADNSIPHDVKAKYCSGQVVMMPAPGRGIIAGSAVRDIFELAGLTDVNAKIMCRTKDKLNIANATIKALESLSNPVGKHKANPKGREGGLGHAPTPKTPARKNTASRSPKGQLATAK